MTDSTLISRAADFAARAHAGQTRRGSDTPQQAATYAAILTTYRTRFNA